MEPESSEGSASGSSSSEEEITEFEVNPLQQYSEYVDSVESAPARGRGRPRIPDQWSQVLSLDGEHAPRIKEYLISTDLLYVKGIRPVPPTRREKEWAPIFFSKIFIKEHPKPTLEHFKLSANKLKALGVQVTRLRQQIRASVERDQIHQAVDQETSLKEVQSLATR